MSETGARRYPRTFNGLIASMVVCVVAVVGYWVLQNGTHSATTVSPASVDYRATVREIQQGGKSVVYPASLPGGWKATDARYQPGDFPTWAIPMLTGSGKFVGLQVEKAPVQDLVEKYIDDHARQGAATTISSSVASSWTAWSDSGGDHGYSATVDEDTVLVYGSAPETDLKRLVGLLTTAQLS